MSQEPLAPAAPPNGFSYPFTKRSAKREAYGIASELLLKYCGDYLINLPAKDAAQLGRAIADLAAQLRRRVE